MTAELYDPSQQKILSHTLRPTDLGVTPPADPPMIYPLNALVQVAPTPQLASRMPGCISITVSSS